MRLIDADALKKTTASINGAMYKVVTAKDIEEAPTVDTVPLEQYQSMEQTVIKLREALMDK